MYVLQSFGFSSLSRLSFLVTAVVAVVAAAAAAAAVAAVAAAVSIVVGLVCVMCLSLFCACRCFCSFDCFWQTILSLRFLLPAFVSRAAPARKENSHYLPPPVTTDTDLDSLFLIHPEPIAEHSHRTTALSAAMDFQLLLRKTVRGPLTRTSSKDMTLPRLAPGMTMRAVSGGRGTAGAVLCCRLSRRTIRGLPPRLAQEESVAGAGNTFARGGWGGRWDAGRWATASPGLYLRG